MNNEIRGPVRSENGESDHGKGIAKRVGNEVRGVAVALLDERWHAGRLDPGEHELRVTRAKVAVSQADLDGLFVDLPKPGRGRNRNRVR